MQNDLSRILYFHLPSYRSERRTISGLDVVKIAEDLGVTPHVLHNWMRRNRIPKNQIEAFVYLENSRLTEETLLPFTQKS